MLSSQKNDEWALHYLAHFFSTHTRIQLFFYANPFFNVKIKSIDHQKLKNAQEQEELFKIRMIQCGNRGSLFFLLFIGFNLTNRSLLPDVFHNRTLAFLFHSIVSILISFLVISRSFMPIIQRSPFDWDAAGIGIQIGLKKAIDLEHDKLTISSLVFFAGWIWFSQLFDSVFNEPTLTYIYNKAAPVFISYLATSRLFYPMIQCSPFSWKTAGAAIQISLMEEINNVMFSSNIPDDVASLYSNIITTDSTPQKTIQTSTSMLSITPHASSSIDDKPPVSDEHKPKEKRRHQSTTAQFLLSLESAPRVVKISWEDTAVEPLYGVIVETKKNKVDIDVIPTPGISSPWSMNSSIHASCRRDLFYQPDHYASTQDPINAQFRRIISLAHVVPPTAHTGLVPIQNDPDFPGAKYKAKLFTKESAKLRVGLFATTFSKSIEFIDDPKKQLPESLKNTVYRLYESGQVKCTH